MRRVIYRLSLFSFSLLILVMLFSMLPIHYKSFYEGIFNSEVGFIYSFAFHNIFSSLMPGVFAIGYTACAFPVLKDNPRQRSIMVVNAIILIVLSVAIGLALFYYALSILHYDTLSRFTKTMVTTGLLTIVLTLVFKHK
jgi:hypothetical protein